MSDRATAVAADLLAVDGLSEDDVAQSFDVMQALGAWQDAARALSELSARYMRLNETDMRAIRMIMRAEQRGQIVTPKDIARAVGISSASTTKLVDRLVDGGHLVRDAHPTDRRTLSIRVTESTRRAAHDTIGRQHARRFAAAAALSPDERAVVIGFLTALIAADAPDGLLVEASHPAPRPEAS